MAPISPNKTLQDPPPARACPRVSVLPLPPSVLRFVPRNPGHAQVADGLGTKTSGSILSPSDVNNLVGIKPTVGLVSRHLVIPISEHQDTVGPMARTVLDAAYLLQAIAGKDKNDNYTSAIPEIPDYVAACNFTSLKGARFGVARNVISLYEDDTSPPVLAAFERSLDIIRQAGATVVDSNFTAFEQFANDNVSTTVLNADFLTDLHNYLTSLSENPRGYTTLDQIRNFTINFPLEDYPDRDVAVWDSALQQGFNNSDPQFWPAYQKNLYYGGEGGILGALQRDNLDAILLFVLTPSCPPTGLTRCDAGRHSFRLPFLPSLVHQWSQCRWAATRKTRRSRSLRHATRRSLPAPTFPSACLLWARTGARRS